METAKLFKNGRSQAVRLPKEFRFEGDEVYVKPVAGGEFHTDFFPSISALALPKAIDLAAME